MDDCIYSIYYGKEKNCEKMIYLYKYSSYLTNNFNIFYMYLSYNFSIAKN